jgi:hypothetical protein
VEGTVEGLNLHNNNRYFTLYERLTARAIRCHIAHRINVAEVSKALERRAIVHGRIQIRSDGVPTAIFAEELEVVPDDSELPSLLDLRGIMG